MLFGTWHASGSRALHLVNFLIIRAHVFLTCVVFFVDLDCKLPTISVVASMALGSKDASEAL